MSRVVNHARHTCNLKTMSMSLEIKTCQRICWYSSSIFRSYGTRQQSRPWKQRPNRKPRLSLILEEDVANLGNKGEMVHVKRGYGRNFLLPKAKAVYATQDNMKIHNTVEKRLFIPKKGTARVKVSFMVGGTDTTVSFLKDKRVTVEQEDDELGWTIHEYQIANALRWQLQCHAPLDCIIVPKPITTYGSTDIQLDIDSLTRVSLPIDVIPLTERKSKVGNEKTPMKERAVMNS